MRFSWTDAVCGCHLLRCSYNILYFLWLDNEFFIIQCNIIQKCCVRLLSNYNIKYACTIYTRLGTCFMSISGCSLRDKVALWLLKLLFYGANVVEWSRALDIMLSDWCCSVSIGVSSNPVERRTKFDSSKNLMITHLV